MIKDLTAFQTNIKGLFLVGTFTPFYSVIKAINAGYLFVEFLVKSQQFKKHKKTNSKDLDLLIVGGGPAGLSAGLTAQKHGVKYLILEEGEVAANIRKYPLGKVFAKDYLGGKDNLLGLLPFKEGPVSETVRVWDKIAKTLFCKNFHSVIDVKKKDEIFLVHTENKKKFQASFVLLAVGQEGSPNRLQVPGEDLGLKVFHRFINEQKEENQNILVVGGGNNAVEAALVLSVANKVTVSYRKNCFSRLSLDNLKKVNTAQKSGELEVLFNSELKKITEDKVFLRQGDQDIELSNDKVYILIGFTPKTEFFKKIGCDFKYCIAKQQQKN